MQKIRLISLSVIIVLLLLLLLALSAGSGLAAEGAGTIIIYNPVPGVFDAVVEGFVQQMVANLDYDSADQLDVTLATDADELAAALELGAGAYVKKPYVIERLAGAVRSEFES